MGEFLGCECLRKDVPNPVSPTAVVFDDFIADMRHCRNSPVFGFVEIAGALTITPFGCTDWLSLATSTP
jgi:hypothetical protein